MCKYLNSTWSGSLVIHKVLNARNVNGHIDKKKISKKEKKVSMVVLGWVFNVLHLDKICIQILNKTPKQHIVVGTMHIAFLDYNNYFSNTSRDQCRLPKLATNIYILYVL